MSKRASSTLVLCVGLHIIIVILITSPLLAEEPQQDEANHTSSKIPLYIGGIFPFSDTHVFLGSFPRIVLAAVEHVNEMEGLLDEYELRMKWGWTYVSIKQFHFPYFKSHGDRRPAQSIQTSFPFFTCLLVKLSYSTYMSCFPVARQLSSMHLFRRCPFLSLLRPSSFSPPKMMEYRISPTRLGARGRKAEAYSSVILMSVHCKNGVLAEDTL